MATWPTPRRPDPGELAAFIDGLGEVEALVVACSGGLDSSVLLHLVHEALPACAGAPRLRALHVNHGLQAEAAAWAEHCRALCAGLGVPLEVAEVDARPDPGESPEAAAREARYRVLAARLGPRDVLLTAHHRDDQAETLLLRLLRGSGVEGLAAMPAVRPLGRARHARPLLDLPRSELEAWARDRGLRWVEDPSNASLDPDRNYLRHEILPRLARRWPGAGRALARSAAHCAGAAAAVAALAARDLEAVAVEGGAALSIPGLAALPPARRAALLRHWLGRHGLPLPGRARLQEALDQALGSRADAQPRVAWAGAELRRHRDRLYAMAPLPPLEPGWSRPWDPAEAVALPQPRQRLRARPAVGAGLALARLQGRSLGLRLRRGGERIRPAGARCSRPLKDLLREAGLPPWIRARLPLVEVDGHLAAVADRWVCEGFAAGPGEPGLVLERVPEERPAGEAGTAPGD